MYLRRNMPRKKSTKKKASAKGETYFKAKNNRWYKKVQIDGKTRVRFVSNAEATGTISASKSSAKKRSVKKPKAAATKPRQRTKKSPPVESPEEEKIAETAE